MSSTAPPKRELVDFARSEHHASILRGFRAVDQCLDTLPGFEHVVEVFATEGRRLEKKGAVSSAATGASFAGYSWNPDLTFWPSRARVTSSELSRPGVAW